MYRVVVESSPKATVQRVEMEGELEHGFFVHYDNGQTAEVSWALVWELPPKNSKNKNPRS
jgi:hypothetical protein